MLFTEFRFFIFLFIVLCVYWSLNKNQHRKTFLLITSYFFYGCWNYRFLSVLFFLSTLDYYFSKKIFEAQKKSSKKTYVFSSVIMNLSVLCYFKYFNFFLNSAANFIQFLGFKANLPTLNILLPVGISFFTFQSLSYTIDVYRNHIKPAKSLSDYLTFAAFFPQLVAGPIVRPHYFLPQLETKKSQAAGTYRELLIIFLLGYIKKTVIADNISPIVDEVFANPQNYSGLSVIIGVWLYTSQIFCDFSGYTDMAIAVAGFLGYKLVPNFESPYLSLSVQEFWRRWHISLSSWIRDYIYISLGGKSKNTIITYKNLFFTMLLGGLWHGAAWTFIAWGAVHGLALIIHREFQKVKIFPGRFLYLKNFLSWFVTINYVCCTWIIFRASSLEVVPKLIEKYFLYHFLSGTQLSFWLIFIGPTLLAFQYFFNHLEITKKWAELNPVVFTIIFAIILSFTFALLPLGYKPFIYFQF